MWYKFLFLLLPIAMLSSCKKENQKTAPFSATGVWKGPVTIETNATVLFVNLPDGQSKFYIYNNASGTDTSNAPIKGYGSYSVNGNIFSANYTDFIHEFVGHVETSGTTTNSMSGVMILATQDGKNEISMFFEALKQQ